MEAEPWIDPVIKTMYNRFAILSSSDHAGMPPSFSIYS